MVGQGQGSHIMLWDLGLYPGTRTLSAAGGLAGRGCRMAHWGGPGPEYDAGWASGAAAGPPSTTSPRYQQDSGGSELAMRAQQLKFTIPRWATAAHGGALVRPEARTSSQLGRRTSADVPSLEYDGCAWLWWGVGDVSMCAGGCAETVSYTHLTLPTKA